MSNIINDRIGSQNVIRVLSNASAPPTKLINLTDVDSTITDDGVLLVWDLPTETFIMTSVIDNNLTISDEDSSFGTTSGAFVVSGGVGIGKNLFIGGDVSISGITTFESRIDLNSSLDIQDDLVVNRNFKSVGITTLSSSGGITTTGGNFFVGSNASVAGNLRVDGTSEFIGVVTFRGGTINLGDEDTDDIVIGGEFASNLNPTTDNLYDLGIEGKRWRNARFSGFTTTGTLFTNGVSTLNGNVVVTGFVTVTEGLYYDLDDYNSPNGIGYFAPGGKLTSSTNVAAGIDTSNSLLTVNESGVPVWTSTIDGGWY